MSEFASTLFSAVEISLTLLIEAMLSVDTPFFATSKVIKPGLLLL